jgi:hypothetical protein
LGYVVVSNMDGVTILTTCEKSFFTTGEYLVIMIVAACVGLLSLSVMNYSKNTWEQTFAIVCCIAAVTVAAACTLIFLCWVNTVYKITVDDTVNFNELTSRYHIISQDGKLFTVKDMEEASE